jgi:hypothetical protein
MRYERLDQSQAEATASAGNDGNPIFEAHLFCSLCLDAVTTIERWKRSQPMSPGAASDNEPCAWLLAEAPSGICKHPQLKDQI